ncbi:MAG: metallophosphoesterase [Ignavibacteria bacterium]|nr:metallophosphoesterase [Ignavibacteria bacterium]
MNYLKIAHISDLHIRIKEETEDGIKFIELLKDIKKRNCDHTVITGDLTENPDSGEMIFLREILLRFSLLDTSKLSIVPGNHDIFGGAPAGVKNFFFPLICRETDYELNTDNFTDNYKETFPNNNSYPYLKIIKSTALIGINSVDRYSEDRNPEGSNGLISENDTEKLNKIFNSEEVKDKYKIILIHHHFYKEELRADYPAHSLWLKSIRRKMKMRNKKKMLRFFRKNGVNLILHGHTHISEIYNVKGITAVNSSGCLHPLTDDFIRKYFIISIPEIYDENESIQIEAITLK